MPEPKTYKTVNVILLVIIAVLFLFISGILFSIQAEKNVAGKVNLLYILNFFLITSIFSFYLNFILMKRKDKQLIASLAGSMHVYNEAEEIKKRNELLEKALQEKLKHLETMLAQENTKEKKFEIFLNLLVKHTESVQAALFLTIEKDNEKTLRFISGYAFNLEENETLEFCFGEGLSGQVAIDKKLMNLSELQIDRVPVYSGMGSAVPENLIICPVLNNNETIGIIELASFKKFDLTDEQFIEKAASLLSNKIRITPANYQSVEGINE